MATQFHITAPDGTQYDVTGPDGATEQDALAQVQAQHGGGAAPPERGIGQRVKDFVGGMGEGAFSIPQHVAALGAEATDGLGLTHGAYDSVKAANAAATAKGNSEGGLDPSSGAYKTGEPVGQAMATAPLAAVNPIGGGGMLAAIGNGALQGAAAGTLTGSPEHPVADGAAGAGIGAVLNGVTHGAASLLEPIIRPAVQALSRAGVTMSPGQLLGGWTKGLEDRLAGLPLIGDPIKNVQRQSLRDFGTGAGNIAMGGLGPIPPGVSGQAMSTTAHQVFDDAYGRILPQLDVTLGPQFAQTVANAGDTVAARLPAEHSAQFDGTLADVFKKMGANTPGPANTFPGVDAKAAYSDLGRMSREYQAPMASPNDRALGRAFGDVQEGVRQSFTNSDPWAASALQNVDNAYRNFIPVDSAVAKATGNAGGTEAGVFTPKQLRQAVVGQDNSVRRMATAEGGGPMQQYAENGIEVLPSSVPDSGTAGRLTLLDFLREPHLALPALATHAAYSGPVIRTMNRAFGQGPSQGASALADILRNLSAVSAPTAGAAMGGK